MYSVVIGNQNTLETLDQYPGIFMDVIHDRSVDLCQWNEEGRTIETAVPELYSCVGDKEDWRVIIVRVEDGTLMSRFCTPENNPYDFRLDVTKEPVKESAVPLVRLTQMLGGVPHVQRGFKAETVMEEGMARRVVYNPVAPSSEDQRAHAALSQKYHFRAKRPSEILLLSVRRERADEADHSARVRDVWTDNREEESSTFWKRNGYPSACRFLVMDVRNLGKAQETEDLFRFWTAVRLLAGNEIDASTIQAYRLLRTEVEIDRSRMGAAVQRLVDRLFGARKYIEQQKQIARTAALRDDAEMPDYKISNIEVEVKAPARRDMVQGIGRFGLVAESSAADLETWDKMQADASRNLRALDAAGSRALDRSAEMVRQKSHYERYQVKDLSRYQREDMKNALAEDYRSFFQKRAALPSGSDKEAVRMQSLAGEITDKVKKRVTRREAWFSFLFIYAVFAIFTVFSALMFRGTMRGNGQELAAAVLLEGCALGLVELLTLKKWQVELNAMIGEYRRLLIQRRTRILENASAYSGYMNTIASYMHGSTYLTLLHQRSTRHQNKENMFADNLEAIETTLEQARRLTEAFHLQVNSDAAMTPDEKVFDLQTAPYENPLYALAEADGAEYNVPLNDTGDQLVAPFDYVKRLRIQREELYDEQG